jgi:hypothetical protein
LLPLFLFRECLLPLLYMYICTPQNKHLHKHFVDIFTVFHLQHLHKQGNTKK